MAYIGKTPITGNFVKLDAISVVNGQAGYTMNNGGSAFTDYENVNQFLVSLNGILQAPTTSFTVSGSTLTFASNLATGDVIDFVIVLGNTLDIGTPSDATVTQAKTNFVSTSSAAGLQIKGDGTTDGTLQLNCSQNSHGIKLKSPPHSANQSYSLKFPSGNVTAGKFLKVDSVSGSGTTGVGTMTFADAGSDFTPRFKVALSGQQTISSSTDTLVAFAEEIEDTDSAFTNTSGNYKFTVPSGEGGVYFLYCQLYFNDTGSNVALQTHIYKNGSQIAVGKERTASNDQTVEVATIETLSASDYIQVYARHNRGSNTSLNDTNAFCYFFGYKLV